jgi:uncharacterized protein YegP (UPF0339 family)
MKFIIYRDPVGQWRWTFEVNGRPLAEGGGAHPTPARCLEDIAQIRSAHLSPVSVSPFPRAPNSESATVSRPLREPNPRADPAVRDALEAEHASS